MNNINIKGTNLELTDGLREYVADKLSQLDRHTAKEPLNVDVELEHLPRPHDGPPFRCEIMFNMPGEKFMLRGDAVGETIEAAIDICLPKIKEQLDREREKRDTEIKKGGRELKEMMQDMVTEE